MNDHPSQTTRPPLPRAPQTVIAEAVSGVCSDGNSDAMRVARGVIDALYSAGFQITEAGEINDAR